jgi:predicted nuclease of predicted toxin-antitoxin system
MLKLLADENFDNNILRGLLRRRSNIDIIRVQDVGLSGENDPTILAYAAQTNRVLLTHDVATITRFAYERITQNLSMSGVVEVSTDARIGQVIEDILMIIDCSLDGKLEGQIYYIPF